MTAIAIERDASRTQPPTGRTARPVPTKEVLALLTMADAATRYLQRVAPHVSPTSEEGREYIGAAIGVDWDISDAIGSHQFDLNASCLMEQRCTASVMAFVLTDRTAIVYRRDEGEWVWSPDRCPRCDRHLLGGWRESFHTPYCSITCRTGRVSARLVAKMLDYLNNKWTHRLTIMKQSEPDIEREPDDPTLWNHGNSDKLWEHMRMVAFDGIDWPATERRQAEIGEHIGVWVLVDRREIRKVGIAPWVVAP